MHLDARAIELELERGLVEFVERFVHSVGGGREHRPYRLEHSDGDRIERVFAAGQCGSGSRREIAVLWARSRLGLGPGQVRCAMFSVPEHWRGLRVPTRGFLRRAHAAGAAVHVWTVDDPQRAIALWTAGVQGIVTNDPAAIVRARQDCVA